MLDKLTQKVGPLPLWAYGVGIAIGIIVARRLLNKAQDTTGQTVDTATADGGYYDPSTGMYFPANGSASGVSDSGTGYTTAAQVIQTDQGTVIIPPTGPGTYGDPIIIGGGGSQNAGGGVSNPSTENGTAPATNTGTTENTTPPTVTPVAPPSYTVPVRVLPPEGAIPSLGSGPGGKILGPGPVWE